MYITMRGSYVPYFLNVRYNAFDGLYVIRVNIIKICFGITIVQINVLISFTKVKLMIFLIWLITIWHSAREHGICYSYKFEKLTIRRIINIKNGVKFCILKKIRRFLYHFWWVWFFSKCEIMPPLNIYNSADNQFFKFAWVANSMLTCTVSYA